MKVRFIYLLFFVGLLSSCGSETSTTPLKPHRDYKFFQNADHDVNAILTKMRESGKFADLTVEALHGFTAHIWSEQESPSAEAMDAKFWVSIWDYDDEGHLIQLDYLDEQKARYESNVTAMKKEYKFLEEVHNDGYKCDEFFYEIGAGETIMHRVYDIVENGKTTTIYSIVLYVDLEERPSI